jgi:hypothetical protein
MTNWSPISDFANLEELCVGVQGFDESLSRPLLRSVKSSCLQQVILGVETGGIRWPSLDENLANLVKRHEGCRDLILRISTKADPEKVRGFIHRRHRRAYRKWVPSSVRIIASGHGNHGSETQPFLAASLSVSCIHFPTTPLGTTSPDTFPLLFSPLPPPNHLIRAANDRDWFRRGYGRRPGICIG